MTAYSPSWTATKTSPEIYNGLILGKFDRGAASARVYGYVRIVMGSATTYGIGAYRFALPVEADLRETISGYALVTSHDGSEWLGRLVLVGGWQLAVFAVTGLGLSAVQPRTLQTGDEIFLQFGYLAA